MRDPKTATAMQPGLSRFKALTWLMSALTSALLVSQIMFINVAKADETLAASYPPGEMVAIGTHRLHLYCKGIGSPTILVDSGMGSLALEWINLQQHLSPHVKVCLYDRAGYGWSDTGPMPRTSEQIANELYFLIQASEMRGPFVLVGHSFGGYNMRLFASKHPEMVAGLVLVDSSHPDQFSRMHIDPRAEIRGLVDHQGKRTRYTVSQPVFPSNYPQQIKFLAHRMLSSRKSNMTRLNEQFYFEQSAEQVKQAGTFPNIPLVVLTHGQQVWPANQTGQKMESIWSELQQELSYLSTVSLQIIAKSSGHAIHLDQPELVSSAILNIVSVSEQIAEAHFHPNVRITPKFDANPVISATMDVFDFAMINYGMDAIPSVYHNDSRYALRFH